MVITLLGSLDGRRQASRLIGVVSAFSRRVLAQSEFLHRTGVLLEPLMDETQRPVN